MKLLLTLLGVLISAVALAADSLIADARDLQRAIDLAPSNSVVRCDPNQTLTFSTPISIRRPITLAGLRARLPEKLGNTLLVIVEAKGVTVAEFELTGNAESVPQSERAPLLVVRAGEFRVERGHFINRSKDGVMIDADGATEDIVAVWCGTSSDVA